MLQIHYVPILKNICGFRRNYTIFLSHLNFKDKYYTLKKNNQNNNCYKEVRNCYNVFMKIVNM